jgi:hypothetical protein
MVCTAEILSLAGFSLVPALLPQFMTIWSLSNAQGGWLGGIMSGGYMVAVLPLVVLTDRVPARSKIAEHCYRASRANGWTQSNEHDCAHDRGTTGRQRRHAGKSNHSCTCSRLAESIGAVFGLNDNGLGQRRM